ncbi:MAG: hypothetical protein ACRETB_11270 [Steroidobacteraceae bacterium]
MKTLIAVFHARTASAAHGPAAVAACAQAPHPRMARRRLVAAAVAGLALCLSAAAVASQGSASPSASRDWHGGWGSATGWWGQGWWGEGKTLDVLPWNYQSFWWKGMPYYYGGAAFYAWDGDVGKYEEVTPPIGFNQPLSGYVAMSIGIPKLSTRLFAYPAGGQSQAQKARDVAECHKLASPPAAPHAAVPPAAANRPPPGRRPPPGAGPGAARGPSGAANARAGRPRRRRGRRSAPIVTGPPPDTLAMQQTFVQAEATCLEKRHYSVR